MANLSWEDLDNMVEGDPLLLRDIAWAEISRLDKQRSVAVSDFREAEESYRVVADLVIELFNPRDDDVAEEEILTRALEAAHAFIDSVACSCSSGSDAFEACARCAVLGRYLDAPVDW